MAEQAGQTAALAQELEALREALNEQESHVTAREAQVAEQRKALERGTAQLAERQAQVETASTDLQQRDEALRKQEAQLTFLQQACEAKMREVEAAAAQVDELRRQLESELERLGAQQDDLLPRYGVTPGAGPETKPVAGIPAPPPSKAQEAMERFRKMCRDAKRKAINAG